MININLKKLSNEELEELINNIKKELEERKLKANIEWSAKQLTKMIEQRIYF